MNFKVDQVWCDVGGTFTDCFVVRPNGQQLYTKILSSGVVKGKAERWLNEKSFVDSARRMDPNGFWIGAAIRWLSDEGDVIATHQCIVFDSATGTVTIDSSSSNVKDSGIALAPHIESVAQARCLQPA